MMPAYMKNSYYKMEMYSGWRHPDNIPSKAAIRKKQKSDNFRHSSVAYGGNDMIFYPIDGGFYPDDDGDFGSGGGDDFGGGGGDDGGGGCGGCGGCGSGGGGGGCPPVKTL